MEKFAALDGDQRTELITSAAVAMGVNEAILEKDFWVCWTLRRLYTDRDLKKKLMFKGGTSLSMVFNLIERFSEDIDLIIRRDVITDKDPMDPGLSGKQRKILLAEIREKTRDYIRSEFHQQVAQLLAPICSCEIVENETAAVTIAIRYPAEFRTDGIRDYILLEPGPLALWTPNGKYKISPLIATEMTGKMVDHPFEVDTIMAERTFWEKATILHEQAHRTEDKPVEPGYSRHYYDLHCMANSSIKLNALANFTILEEVANYKKCCYPRGWARYDDARPGTLRLMPPDHVERDLRKNYEEAESMYYGERPTFDKILEQSHH